VKLKIRKRTDFGGFQSPEVKGGGGQKKSKNCEICIFGFNCEKPNI
jgi:hypothetical protein